MASFKTHRGLLASSALILPALLFGSVPSASAQCAELPGCVLVWSDEFDGTEVDLAKWSFQLGDGTEVGLPPGWGNNELQYYRAENATVAGGFLRSRRRRSRPAAATTPRLDAPLRKRD